MNEAKTESYGSDYIFGNLAYDLSRVERVGDLPEYERIPEAAPKPRVSERAGVKASAKAHSAQSLAPFSIIGFVCVAVLLVFMLMAYVRLTEISEESAALETQLSELQTEQTRLLIDYESAFNLTEIEDYATNVLGMQKPRSDQIFYVDSAAADRAEVVSDGTQESGLWAKLGDILSSLGEYFK